MTFLGIIAIYGWIALAVAITGVIAVSTKTGEESLRQIVAEVYQDTRDTEDRVILESIPLHVWKVILVGALSIGWLYFLVAWIWRLK